MHDDWDDDNTTVVVFMAPSLFCVIPQTSCWYTTNARQRGWSDDVEDIITTWVSFGLLREAY